MTISASVVAKLGSPPRVRGTGLQEPDHGEHRRITPARAGNSMCPMTPGPGMEDHPRACGEQAREKEDKDGMKGSPPRVRGTVYA